MSKPANMQQGRITAGKKLAAKQEAAVVKSQKAFRKNVVRSITEPVGYLVGPKKVITGAKLLNKTIKTIRSK